MTKAVLFDADGTLLDTYEYIVEAYQYVADKEGAPVSRESAVLLASRGYTLRQAYTSMFPNHDIQRLVQNHRDFQEKNMQLVKIFPKVRETLQTLNEQNIKRAVVTNRLRKSAIAILTHLKILDMFDGIFCPEDVLRSKPDPDHVLTALRALDVKASETWFIGDTPVDIEAGKAAGVRTIGISYGPRAEISAYGPDHVIYNIEDILPIVLPQLLL